MGDIFYRAVRFVGKQPFWASSSPVISGLDNVPVSGPVIIASNHTSPFDVPLLIRHIPRPVDFVSIVEVFRNPFVAWFYGSMNAFPLDRAGPDAPTVRTILNRLEKGRVVGMFPEGGLRRGEASVVRGGRIRSGVGRLSVLANAPVAPAIVLNSSVYSGVHAWLPIRRTRYGVAVGPCISPQLGAEEIEARLVEGYARLYAELAQRLPVSCRDA